MKQINYKNFEKSSVIYDQMYKNKNYSFETDYLKKLIIRKKINNLLDLGCGTCSHLINLSRLCKNAFGVDINNEMLQLGKEKIKKKKIKNIKLFNKNILNFKSKKKFEIIISLFHVVNYLHKKKEISNFFSLASKMLKKDGILIFDFWHKHSNSLKKSKTLKIIKNKKYIIKRTANSKYNPKTHKTTVDFHYSVKNLKTGDNNHFSERHKMISFDKSKLIKLSNLHGLTFVSAYKWLTKKDLRLSDKTGLIIFKKKSEIK
jgi:ubiquinone/menaquinone biosynthesis C-methylase UbiE